VRNIVELDPGHQCYKLDSLAATITPGTNATLQMQYTSTYPGENNGQREPFYACADIVCSINPHRRPTPLLEAG